MPFVRQFSFAGGELAPTLYGRSDSDVYATALRRCRNFFINPHGSASNRPGLRFVDEVKDHARRVRLVPFIFSDSQAYVLEVGHLYIRYYFEGSGLVSELGARIETTTTYTEEQLERIRFVQSGDVLTLVHPEHPPRELRRTIGATPQTPTWALIDIPFATRSVSPPTGLTWDESSNPSFTGAPNQLGDSTHPAREWGFVVTSIDPATGEESLPSSPLVPPGSGLLGLATHIPARFHWTAVAGVTEYPVYRGRNGLYGYVGSAFTASWKDDDQEPNYQETPPAGTNPFNAVQKYPSTVAYFQERLVLANTVLSPQTAWCTKTGFYKSFDASSPPRDDDAITFSLASREMEEIRALASIRKSLLAFTSGAVWNIGGAEHEPLVPTNIDATPEVYRGSSWLSPIVVDDVALYVDASEESVRDLLFNQEVGGYRGADLCVFSSHLFGRTKYIADWTWAPYPHGIVWVVRSDGVLLSLTYLPEYGVRAWARHDTEGLFENIVSVPEDGESVVYAVVQRTVSGATRRYVERFASRRFEELGDAVFVDSALSLDGNNTGATTFQVGGTLDIGGELAIHASAATFEASNVGSHVVLEPDAEDAAQFLITGYVSPTEVEAEPLTAIPDRMLSGATSTFAGQFDWVAGVSEFGTTAAGQAVGYGGGVWIITASLGKLSRSEDNGLTWEAVTIPGIGYIVSVAYGAGTFVIVGQAGACYRSTDLGVTWTAATLTGMVSEGRHVIYSEALELFICCGGLLVGGAICTSPTAETWTPRHTTTSGGFTRIIEGGGSTPTLVAVGYGNTGTGSRLISSHDGGMTWTERIGGIGNPALNGAATDGNGTWLAAGSTGATLYSLDDAVTWTTVSVGTSSTIFTVLFAEGLGQWLLGLNAGIVLISSDIANTWAPGFAGFPTAIRAMRWTGKHVLIAGDGGRVAASTDGWNWAAQQLDASGWGGPATNGWKAAAVADGRIVMTGSLGHVYSVTEPDPAVTGWLTPTDDWALAYHRVTELGHLEGCSVSVLADANVQGPFVVTGGAVELDAPASVVHVGLPYVSELELLDIAQSAKGKRMIVSEVQVEVDASRGLEVGETFEDMSPWVQREVANSWDPVPESSEIAEVQIASSWNTSGRVAIRQSDPLPVTVLSVTRKVTLSDE